MHYHYNQHHKYKNMQQLHQINPLKLKEAALKLRLIKTNWEILSLINNTPDMSQTDLVVILRKDQAYVSKIIGYLKRAGLVEATKVGKEVRYSISEHMLQVATMVKVFIHEPKKMKYETSQMAVIH